MLLKLPVFESGYDVGPFRKSSRCTHRCQQKRIAMLTPTILRVRDLRYCVQDRSISLKGISLLVLYTCGFQIRMISDVYRGRKSWTLNAVQIKSPPNKVDKASAMLSAPSFASDKAVCNLYQQ